MSRRMIRERCASSIKSAGREDIYGMVNLGILYRDGAGVEKYPSQARDLFEKARAEGHPYAGRLLGLMAQNEGNADTAQVAAWFRESAERGDAWGAFYAADLIDKNPSLQANDGEAVRLYALAASQKAGKPSEAALKALEGTSKSAVGAEVQRTLKRMGQDVGDIDGVVGAKSKNAAATVLGGDAPKSTADMLMALVRKEWLDARPRLDML